MGRRVIAIAAMDEQRVIGLGNRLPWNLPEDLARFKSLTLGQAVLMGRKTWDSLPPRARPLPGRTSIVLSSRPEAVQSGPNVKVWSSLEEGLAAFEGTLWVAGGAEVYRISLPYWDELALTLVYGKHQGDAFFPRFEEQFALVEEDARETFSYRRYLRKA